MKKIKIKWAYHKGFVKKSDICRFLPESHLRKIKSLSNARDLQVVPDKDWDSVKFTTWFWVVA